MCISQLKFFQGIYLGSLCPGFQILKEFRIQTFLIQRDFFQAFPAIPSLWVQGFYSFGWPWLVMFPSSGPKRGNYHWPGETISKIISCVASDRNSCQGTDPVLELEVSSHEPLLWGWSPVPTATISACLTHWATLTATVSPSIWAWLGGNMTQHKQLLNYQSHQNMNLLDKQKPHLPWEDTFVIP